MRYPVANLGGMLDDYIKEREDFKNRFRPAAPTYGTPPPPSGIEPAKTICNILRALKAEMAEDFPSQSAIDEYQKIFDETLTKIGDAGRRSAELFIRQFCPEAAHFYSGLLNQSRLIDKCAAQTPAFRPG